MKKVAYEPYKVALVGIDLTDMDDHLIQYTAMIGKILPLERIYFVHVAKKSHLPANLLKEYPGLLEPLDKSIENDILDKVNQYFGKTDIAIKCLVKEGHPIEKILQLSKTKNADLILMGRKKSLHGSGIVSSKIARKCPCSLLLVTPDNRQNINKLLVSTDFSKHAALATMLALDISVLANTNKLEMIHVYQVPESYYKTGKSYDDFDAIMKVHAEKSCIIFLNKNGFPSDVPCEFLLSKKGKYHKIICDYAEKNDIDLIVIGSKGRTNISAILMGSVAEKLVYYDSQIPILIVKNKGENMGLINTLMEVQN